MDAVREKWLNFKTLLLESYYIWAIKLDKILTVLKIKRSDWLKSPEYLLKQHMFKSKDKVSSSKQIQFRNKYYKAAWNRKVDQINDMIAAGERNAFRIIKALSREDERLNQVKINLNGETESLKSSFYTNPYEYQMLPTGVPAYRISYFQNNFSKVPYYANWIDFLSDCLHDKQYEAVIELGSGYGRNLVGLYYHSGPRNIPYYAGEFVEQGAASTELLSSLIEGIDLIPFKFDAKNPDVSIIKEKKKICFFTAHSIEQIDKLPDDFFSILCHCAENVTGIHFEPVGFQIDNGGKNDQAAEYRKNEFKDKGFNLNMIELLERSQQNNELEILYKGKDIDSMAVHYNDWSGIRETSMTSVIIWEKTK